MVRHNHFKGLEVNFWKLKIHSVGVKILSSLEKEGSGLLFDQVKVLLERGMSMTSRSRMTSLNAHMMERPRMSLERSMSQRTMLKSPVRIQGWLTN